MTIPMWLFIFLICTNAGSILILFLFFYFIAGLHDLHVANKVAKSTCNDCPYFVDKDNQDNSKT